MTALRRPRDWDREWAEALAEDAAVDLVRLASGLFAWASGDPNDPGDRPLPPWEAAEHLGRLARELRGLCGGR